MKWYDAELYFFLVRTLNCYAPKLEWSKSHTPVFRKNNFELTKCNTGLQKCFGGCKHCLAIDGPSQVKSCAGDVDIALEMLGLNADGCRNLTKADNMKYVGWISDTFGNGKQTLLTGFTRVCRCSWNGCNGLPTLELLQNKDLFVQNNASAGMRRALRQQSFRSLYLSLILFIMAKSLCKHIWISVTNKCFIRILIV